jgi:hypothetical protein
MSAQNTATTNWIRAGLLALPLYGLLTFATTFDAQPDQVKEPEAWARYVSSTSYLVTHMLAAPAARGAWGWRRWSPQPSDTPCSWCPP